MAPLFSIRHRFMHSLSRFLSRAFSVSLSAFLRSRRFLPAFRPRLPIHGAPRLFSGRVTVQRFSTIVLVNVHRGWPRLKDEYRFVFLSKLATDRMCRGGPKQLGIKSKTLSVAQIHRGIEEEKEQSVASLPVERPCQSMAEGTMEQIVILAHRTCPAR